MITSNRNCYEKHEPMPCQKEAGAEYSLDNELRENDAINASCWVVNVYVVSLQVRQDHNLPKYYSEISGISNFSINQKKKKVNKKLHSRKKAIHCVVEGELIFNLKEVFFNIKHKSKILNLFD